MALLNVEGFEAFGTSTGSAPSPTGVVARKYLVSSNPGFTVETGRVSGYSLKMSNATLTIPLSTTDATITVGFAFKSSLLTATNYFLRIHDAVNWCIRVYVAAGNVIRVDRGSTTIATSVTTDINDGNWHYIEVKVKCHDSTGTVEVRVGGVSVITATGLDTKDGTQAYYNFVDFIGDSFNRIYLLDDLYICDGTGAVNNDFLGNKKVTTIQPDGAGDSTQLTPSAGNNYNCVDEAICNDDTDYVESATTDHTDLYNYAAVALSNISGLQINTDCRETDATTFGIHAMCKSGATTDEAASVVIGTTNYVTKTKVHEVDPNTSAAWTDTNVSAAQFGVKVH
jgi:hypothetical protein